MTSLPPTGSQEPGEQSDNPTHTVRARLSRARLSLPLAGAGLLLLIALGAAVGLFLTRGMRPPVGQPDRAAQSPDRTATPQLDANSGTTQPTLSLNDTNTTPTLVVARPHAFPTGLPTPHSRAGTAAFGPFELGGQLEHDNQHAGLMRAAGMTWLRVEVPWQANLPPARLKSTIDEAHALGFNILLTISGGTRHPTTISIPAYLDYLRGIAAYGPDAIEVWHAPNNAQSWPQNRIDGEVYTLQMLAPAFNTIKSVDPTIIVISGALGESAAGVDVQQYLAQMASASAGNYLDCAGVSYTTGAQPPAESGELADTIQQYENAFRRPVCFVELGYLSPEGYGSPPAGYSWAEGITAADQAAWLAEAAQISRESGDVRLLVVWNVDYLSWTDAGPSAGYAILRPDGSCPACDRLP